MIFLPFILAFVAAGCSFAVTRRSEETVNANTDYGFDQNPKVYSCAEGTGTPENPWVSGEPQEIGDYFVRIGDVTVDTRKNLYSVRTLFRNITYIPQVDFQFKLGSDKPLNVAEFKASGAILTKQLLKDVTGQYPCVQRHYDRPQIIYVVGHTDSLGREEYNQKLSEARALKVANAIRKWMEKGENRSRLIMPVTIKYLGMGERIENDRGRLNHDNPLARKVEVLATTGSPPYEGDWQVLGTVSP